VNLKKLRNANLKRPTAQVLVPELAGVIFETGEAALLTVRGLSANQLFLAYDAMKKTGLSAALTDAVKALNEKGTTDDLTDVFKQAIGASEEPVAQEVAFRSEVIRFGVIDDKGQPVFMTTDATKLGEHYPESFKKLSTKILELSGEGSQVGE